jgi:hypothetical protein
VATVAKEGRYVAEGEGPKIAKDNNYCYTAKQSRPGGTIFSPVKGLTSQTYDEKNRR